MWRALKIAWRIAWGIVELAIIYVLDAIQDRQTGLITVVVANEVKRRHAVVIASDSLGRRRQGGNKWHLHART